jgi:hypothetical protein
MNEQKRPQNGNAVGGRMPYSTGRRIEFPFPQKLVNHPSAC